MSTSTDDASFLPVSTPHVVYIPFVSARDKGDCLGVCPARWRFGSKYSLLLSELGLSEDAFNGAIEGANAVLAQNERFLVGRLVLSILTISGVLLGFIYLSPHILPLNELLENGFLIVIVAIWCATMFGLLSIYRIRQIRAIKNVELYLRRYFGDEVFSSPLSLRLTCALDHRRFGQS